MNPIDYNFLIAALICFMISNLALMIALFIKIDKLMPNKGGLPKYENPPPPPIKRGYGYQPTDTIKTPPPGWDIPAYALKVYGILRSSDLDIIEHRPIATGYQFKTTGRGIVNVYNTGRVLLQGKPNETLKELFQ